MAVAEFDLPCAWFLTLNQFLDSVCLQCRYIGMQAHRLQGIALGPDGRSMRADAIAPLPSSQHIPCSPA